MSRITLPTACCTVCQIIFILNKIYSIFSSVFLSRSVVIGTKFSLFVLAIHTFEFWNTICTSQRKELIFGIQKKSHKISQCCEFFIFFNSSFVYRVFQVLKDVMFTIFLNKVKIVFGILEHDGSAISVFSSLLASYFCREKNYFS